MLNWPDALPAYHAHLVLIITYSGYAREGEFPFFQSLKKYNDLQKKVHEGVMSLETQNACWSFDTWFTGFGNPDYEEFKESIARDIEKAKTESFNLQGNTGKIALMLNYFESLSDRFEHLLNYLHCLFAANPNDEAIKKDKAWGATLQAEMIKLKTSLEVALANLSEMAFKEVCESASLQGAEYAIHRMRKEGQLKMKMEMEELAADLNVNGLHAWGRLYETISSGMSFPMTFPDGHTEIVPMSRRRALMAEPNRLLRETAFYEGQKPWIDHGDACAACLNGIAGTRLSLYNHRGIPHFLNTPLFDNALSQKSLDAMLEAIHENIELPRRILRASARLQGTSALHYFDLEAPQVVTSESSLSWKDGCDILQESLQSAYPKMGQYFQEMLKMRWIEAEPREGKASGAFLSLSRWKKEERVYMSFYGTLHDLVTLAHEVGHAWHSYILRPKRSFVTHYPMTLAETASNFGEMVLLNSLMNDSAVPPQDKAYLIDQQMLRAHAYILNIPMRYEFEKAFYTKRMSGELSVSQINELMTQTQMECYGDTLLPDGADPMFWASKMHFFITDLSFYNFPYAFGYLLSQALYGRFKEEGASFLPRYEAFLADTGSASCEEVARKTLGVDLTNPDFWASAIRTIEPLLQEYEALSEMTSCSK